MSEAALKSSLCHAGDLSLLGSAPAPTQPSKDELCRPQTDDSFSWPYYFSIKSHLPSSSQPGRTFPACLLHPRAAGISQFSFLCLITANNVRKWKLPGEICSEKIHTHWHTLGKDRPGATQKIRLHRELNILISRTSKWSIVMGLSRSTLCTERFCSDLDWEQRGCSALLIRFHLQGYF